MTIKEIEHSVLKVIKNYPVKRVVLFGSRAEGTNHKYSDVDLIMEFFEPVSLLTLSEIRLQLEDIMGLEVDIIHGPLQNTDFIEVGKEIELYAA
ncbi:MAG: nucleotidyltransferase domain-containing protein [Lachnospiraceae bacterium]|nr:nucleotidyltransferase domain-containing protein [Lachnospiraceae bacterium]